MTQRFAVSNICYFSREDGCIFEFTTNRPCHLWLLYTGVEPATHMEPVFRRGLWMHENPRFCFVAYQQLEQHEAGDTIIHSFNWHPFPTSIDMWSVLKGTVGGVESPSTSPIMHYHQANENATMVRKQVGMSNSGKAVTYNTPRAMSFKAEAIDLITGVKLWMYAPTEHRKLQAIVYPCDIQKKPTYPPLAITTYSHLPDKTKWPTIGYFFIPFEKFFIRLPHWYCLVLTGDPDYPDDLSIWWSRNPLPPDHSGEVAWKGLTSNGSFAWIKDTDSVLQYQLWRSTSAYHPCWK